MGALKSQGEKMVDRAESRFTKRHKWLIDGLQSRRILITVQIYGPRIILLWLPVSFSLSKFLTKDNSRIKLQIAPQITVI